MHHKHTLQGQPNFHQLQPTSMSSDAASYSLGIRSWSNVGDIGIASDLHVRILQHGCVRVRSTNTTEILTVIILAATCQLLEVALKERAFQSSL